MGLTDKIGIAILCAFVLFSVVRLGGQMKKPPDGGLSENM